MFENLVFLLKLQKYFRKMTEPNLHCCQNPKQKILKNKKKLQHSKNPPKFQIIICIQYAYNMHIICVDACMHICIYAYIMHIVRMSFKSILHRICKYYAYMHRYKPDMGQTSIGQSAKNPFEWLRRRPERIKFDSSYGHLKFRHDTCLM